MNKGYAFGFLIVLLIVILGLYVAFTGFRSSRDALRAQSAAVPTNGFEGATAAPSRPVPTPTPTIMLIPTPLPGITATLTTMASSISVVTEAPPTTAPPPPPPTEPPPIQPTDTSRPPPPPPTPIPAPSYQFRLAGPPGPDPSYSICCYIFGSVRDAAGNGLEGVRVQGFNEWATLPPATTKGGSEAGQYNIPIGRDVVKWYVMVVDGSGTQISSQVQIQFDPGIANAHRVDWQRTY